MARPKIYHGMIGVYLPEELDTALRVAAKVTGKSLSDLVRESLCKAWGVGQEPREMQQAGR